MQQAMLDREPRDRRNLNNPIAHRLWIISLEQSAAGETGIWVVSHHLINACSIGSRSGGIKPSPPLEGGYCCAKALRLSGVGGAPGNLPPPVCQLGGQGSELAAQQLDVLLLGVDKRSDDSCSLQPVRIWNSRRQ